ncbi:Ubiquitin-protein ligase E3B [Nowakowskiella sp. JEL0407]|nr:Ubiquitin-protein ligase E3B [Nowakowskiella sp. JEL0407]
MKSVQQKAREDRLLREQKRREEQDALLTSRATETICRAIWRFVSQRRALHQLRTDWDALLVLLAQSTVSPSDFLKLIALFVRFFNPAIDAARLTSLCKFIHSKQPKDSPWLTLISSQNSTHAESYLQSFLWICLQQSLNPSYFTGMELLVLVVYGDHKRFPQTCAAAYARMSEFLVRKGMLNLISIALIDRIRLIVPIVSRTTKVSDDEKKLTMYKNWFRAVIHISLFSLHSVDQDRAVNNHKLLQFTVNILSTPVLLSAAADDLSLQLLIKNNILERVCDLLNDNESDRQFAFSMMEGEGTLFFIGNMVDLYKKQSQLPQSATSPSSSKSSTPSKPTPTKPETLHIRFMSMVTLSLCHCKSYVSEKSTNKVVYHQLFEWYSGKSLPNLTPAVFTISINQISLLWNRDQVVKLFDPLLKLELDATTKVKITQTSTTCLLHVREVCTMYLAVMNVLTKHRMKVLSNITYVPDLVPKLWRIMKYIGPSGGVKVFLESVKNQPEKEHYMPLLEMFCECLSILFQTLDNEEIYEKQSPFTLSELCEISSFLNNFCFSIYWNTPSTAKGPLPRFLDPAKKLLKQLYDRNSRRPFGDDDVTFLVVKEVKKASFVTDIQGGDERATKILMNLPQCIPFKSRGKDDIFFDMKEESVLEDGYRTLHKLTPHQFKQTIRVKFISKLGLEEAGIDQSGVFKEFLEDLCKGAFSADFNLFKSTPDGSLYPSPTSFVHPEHLDLLEFFGKVLGKALYEGITIDIPFALFMYAKLQGSYSILDDLPSLDPQLYKNLIFLKNYKGDCEDLGLNFTIDLDIFGDIVTKEIKPGGKI